MRTLSLAVHGFLADRCPLRAAALTLVFIFSLAPALAVGFSLAGGFGVQEKIKPAIYRHLGLMDAEGNLNPDAEALRGYFDTIMSYVEGTRFQALGLIGTAIIFLAAYKVLSSIEKTMNHIWGVRRRRRLVRKIVDYLAVLVVSPVLLLMTSLVTASVRSGTVLGYLGMGKHALIARVLGALVALLFAALGFWFLYFFFPNTPVRMTSAAAGAVVAAILWQAWQSIYLWLQVGVSKYNAIYGTLAAFPIFVLWLYVAWQMILFGAELSYAHANHSDIEFGGLEFAPSPAYREQLALGAMTLAASAFLKEAPAATCEEMAHRLAAPLRVMRQLLEHLTSARLLVELQGDHARFQPAAPLDQITLGRVLHAVCDRGDQSSQTLKMLERLGVAHLLDQREQATATVHNITLLDLAQAAEKSK